MVTTLTAGNKDLCDLLADFRASVEAAQQQHASWSASAAKFGRQSSQTSKEASTAGSGSAGQPQAADKTLQDLQGRTEAAAVAASEHITVVKQLIDLVSGLNRRCNSSSDQLHHLTSAVHQIQLDSADLQAQLVTAADNQRDAATQITQVLDISKHLQSCIESLACELDAERSSKKRLQKQTDAVQQQVLFQGEALSALQSAAVDTAGQVEELKHHSKQTSASVVTLLSSRSQLHKQLQKLLLVQQQLSTDIRDTQTVVAGELAAIRKHVQLVNGRTSQSCKHHKAQLSNQISNITSRVEELEQQLTMLLTARTAAAAAAGSRRGATEQSIGRGHSRSGPTQRQPQSQQQQQQQQQQQRHNQQMMSDLLALLDSEASELSNDPNRSGQSVAEAARLIADDVIAAAAGAAAESAHNACSSSTRKKKKKKSKKPPWRFEVLEVPPQRQQQQQQQQQQEVEEVALRKQNTASNSMKWRQVRSSKLAEAVKDRLVAQQQQQQQLEQQQSDSVDASAQPQGVGLGRHGPAVKTQAAPRKKRARWIP